MIFGAAWARILHRYWPALARVVLRSPRMGARSRDDLTAIHQLTTVTSEVVQAARDSPKARWRSRRTEAASGSTARRYMTLIRSAGAVARPTPTRSIATSTRRTTARIDRRRSGWSAPATVRASVHQANALAVVPAPLLPEPVIVPTSGAWRDPGPPSRDVRRSRRWAPRARATRRHPRLPARPPIRRTTLSNRRGRAEGEAKRPAGAGLLSGDVAQRRV